MAGVQAGKAVDLVAVSAVLVARLQQLAPDGVEGFMVAPAGGQEAGRQGKG